MRGFLKNVCFLITAFFLISCDPPHSISFINKTNTYVSVELELFPDAENYTLQDLAVENVVTLNIAPNNTENIHFGIGTWSDEEIEEFGNTVKTIEIETIYYTKTYKTKKGIKHLLKENRNKFLLIGAEIKIEIE
ncbi:MAG: hypothetical protein PHC38_12465 [Weeksellaceae bacterium]|nr:hypothetical protein [Weeksellaceae bacterium]